MFLPSNITLKFGDSGDFVTELQRRLSVVHCFNADAINGFFDGTTVNGVSQFQSMSGIRSDGIAGPETLRRLNGVISGDNSSATDHKAEEEARLRQEALNQQIQQQAYLAQQQQQAQPVQTLDAAYGIAAPIVEQPLAQQPKQPEVNYVQQAAYAPQQPIVQAPPAVDVLAQMLLTPAQPAIANAAQNTPAIPANSLPPALTVPAAVPTPAQILVPPPPARAQAEIPQASQATEPQPVAAAAVAPASPVATAETAPKGIIGRAVQYANDMVQKLANYFEAKLPTHVINEVKDIGLTMSKSGVKEVAIPAGPEQQRSADTPARSPQQQAQVPQRN
jgi:peptidoglycan hydrolase-like protein with peptidoglycan-binding domain